MIQPNELRIGNLVEDASYLMDETKRHYVPVTAYMFYLSFNDELKDFRPIQLTEEWLLKFGFTKYGKNTFYKKDEEGNGVGIKCDDWGIFSDSEFIIYGQQDWVYLVGYLQYVHQLQNLFFSLTGKELEYDSSK